MCSGLTQLLEVLKISNVHGGALNGSEILKYSGLTEQLTRLTEQLTVLKTSNVLAEHSMVLKASNILS